MKKQVVVVCVSVLAIAIAGVWWLVRPEQDPSTLTLHGNVDIRQISLAFEGSERVAEMRVEEGDKVMAGQVLAVLDTRTLAIKIAQSQAQIGVQEQEVLRLRNGSRPQEVAQAKARVDAAVADVTLANQDLQRLQSISRNTGGHAISRQELERATSQLHVAQAQEQERRKGLQLAQLGPRSEDIAEADAELQVLRANLALLHHRMAQAELKAPTNAVVRARLLEPGDMASPQRAAYTLALTEPKWIRAYISESQLGHVQPGKVAQVSTDSYPDQSIGGRVGYISSVAEFTPKSVETEELRTNLVYEIRVLVNDPTDRLRLGMPATVRFTQDNIGEDHR